MISAKMQTLLMVAELQNFTKAAQALSMTQPAVSHHIKQLEEELGAPCLSAEKWPAFDPAGRDCHPIRPAYQSFG